MVQYMRKAVLKTVRRFSEQQASAGKPYPLWFGGGVRDAIAARYAHSHIGESQSPYRHIPYSSDLDLIFVRPDKKKIQHTKDSFLSMLQIDLSPLYKVIVISKSALRYNNCDVLSLHVLDQHPMMPKNICLKIDLVFQYGPMWPDFTSNMFCIDIDKIRLLSQEVYTPLPIWYETKSINRLLHPSYDAYRNCDLLNRQVSLVRVMECQIEQRITHVLLYRPSTWISFFGKNRDRITASKTYLSYVQHIIVNRCRKLLSQGWNVLGIMDGVTYRKCDIYFKCLGCATSQPPEKYAIFFSSMKLVLKLNGQMLESTSTNKIATKTHIDMLFHYKSCRFKTGDKDDVDDCESGVDDCKDDVDDCESGVDDSKGEETYDPILGDQIRVICAACKGHYRLCETYIQ